MTDGHRHIKVEGLERLLGIETGIERGIETEGYRGRDTESLGTHTEAKEHKAEGEGRRRCGA